MDRKQASRVLGVAPDATADEIRAAFRGLVRTHHPDVAGTRGTARTAELIAAYRSLQGPPPAAPSRPAAPRPRARPRPRRPPDEARSEGDSVWAALPATELWPHLLEVAHGLGEVAYVDRSAGLLETVVTFVEYPVCSVVLNVQGRANGMTEAFVTVESLTGDRPPPTSGVAKLFATSLAEHLAEHLSI